MVRVQETVGFMGMRERGTMGSAQMNQRRGWTSAAFGSETGPKMSKSGRSGEKIRGRPLGVPKTAAR